MLDLFWCLSGGSKWRFRLGHVQKMGRWRCQLDVALGSSLPESIFSHLWAIWAVLGPILADPGAVLGPSWVILGPSWATSGHLGAILAFSGALFGPSWLTWGHLGQLYGASWGDLGYLPVSSCSISAFAFLLSVTRYLGISYFPA